jgi:uncharacterized protein (TIGR03067 family)
MYTVRQASVDPIAEPKTIDVTFTGGPEEGKTSKGIFELEGDTSKGCVGLAGRERPKEFASTLDALQVLKREES